jgi:hypothetical protein
MRGERFVRNVAPGLSGRVIVTSTPSAGLTIPLVDKTFTPDGAASAIKDGTTSSPYLKIFPYLGTPAGGYQTLPGTSKV